MDNENRNENEETVPILLWDEKSTKPREARVPAIGNVPVAVWEAFNKAFQKRQAKGWFESASLTEAYNFVAEKILKKAEERTDLTGAAQRVYLLGVMYSSLREFGSKQIAKARQNTRNVEKWQREMVKRNRLDEEEVDTASLMELLPYVERPSDTHLDAKRTLNEIMPRLPPEVQAAFRAYLATDGNFFAMSAQLGVPVSTLYRKWKRYLATARRILEFEGWSKKSIKRSF